MAAYVELHIEQGLVVAERNAEIGIVTASWASGGMRLRWKDAPITPERLPCLFAATPWLGRRILSARSTSWRDLRPADSPYLVATVGKLSVEPNAINAVPGSVSMILDARSTDPAALGHFEQELWKRVEGELEPRGLRLSVSLLSQTLPTICSPLIQDTIEQAATAAGVQQHPIAQRRRARWRVRRSHRADGHDLCALQRR